MQINHDLLKLANEILIQDTVIYGLDKAEIKNLDLSYCCDDGVKEELLDVLIAKVSANEISNKSPREILYFIVETELEYRVKKYLVDILSRETNINPFLLLINIKDKNEFWQAIDLIGQCLENAKEYSIDIVIPAIKCLYTYLKNDYNYGYYMNKLNNWLKKNKRMSNEIVEWFFHEPKEELQTAVIMALENIIKVDYNTGTRWVGKLYTKGDGLSVATVCASLYVLLETNINFVKGNLHILDGVVEKNNNKNAIRNTLAIYTRVVMTQECNFNHVEIEKMKKVIKDMVGDNDDNKYSVLSNLNKLCLDDYSTTLLEIIFKTSVGDNLGLIKLMDEYLVDIINIGRYDEALKYLYIFYAINYNKFYKKPFNEYFAESFKMFINKFDHIINILQEKLVFGTTIDVKFSVELLEYSTYSTKYKKLNFVDMTDSSIQELFKVITLFSINGKFVSTVGFKLVKLLKEQEALDKFIEFFIDTVCANYSNTVVEVANQYDCTDKSEIALKVAILACSKERESYRKIIYSIKDLSPSNRRLYEYRVQDLKMQEDIKRKVDEKSIMQMLSNKQVLKYGNSYAYRRIDSNGDTQILQSEFKNISYSIDLPFLFMNDPYSHWYEKKILEEERREKIEANY